MLDERRAVDGAAAAVTFETPVEHVAIVEVAPRPWPLVEAIEGLKWSARGGEWSARITPAQSAALLDALGIEVE